MGQANDSYDNLNHSLFGSYSFPHFCQLQSFFLFINFLRYFGSLLKLGRRNKKHEKLCFKLSQQKIMLRTKTCILISDNVN